MAFIRRHHLRFGAIFVLALSAWLAGGQALHRSISNHSNTLVLEDISQQLIRRAEKAIDFVVIANSEFLVAGHNACDEPARNMLLQLVIDTGTVSDVYMVTPTGVCSSFEQLSNPCRQPANAQHGLKRAILPIASDKSTATIPT